MIRRDLPPDRSSLDDTVPRLEKLVNSPREFEWRQALVDSVESIRKSHHRLDKEMVAIRAFIEHKMLGPVDVAKIAKTEIAAEKLERSEKIKWISVGGAVSLAVTLLGKWLLK